MMAASCDNSDLYRPSNIKRRHGARLPPLFNVIRLCVRFGVPVVPDEVHANPIPDEVHANPRLVWGRVLELVSVGLTRVAFL